VGWAGPLLAELGFSWQTRTDPDGAADLPGLAADLAAAPRDPGPAAAAARHTARMPLDSALRAIQDNDPANSPGHHSMARNLRAAALHYARTGNVHATRTEPVTLPDGDQVWLGRWQNYVRYAPRKLRWAGPVLAQLRFYTGTGSTSGGPDGAADLAGLAADLAAAPREPGADSTAPGSVWSVLDGALRAIMDNQRNSLTDVYLARYLRAAALHHAHTGNVKAGWSDSVFLPEGPVRLGRCWLRSGEAVPRWAGPVLAALGMEGLPEDQDQDQPVPGDQGGPAPGEVTRTARELDQARRGVMEVFPEEAERARRGDGDEELWLVARWEPRYRLLPRPQSDREFPWRDPADPLDRVCPPFAGPDGRQACPAVQVARAEMGACHGMLARLVTSSVDQRLAGPPGPRDSRAVGTWVEGTAQRMARQVQDLVQATISGTRAELPAEPRILYRWDVLDHEQDLAGQYGVFLTDTARTAPPGGRALLSEGRVLGLFGGALPDSPEAAAQWNATYRHIAMSYAVPVRGRGTQTVTMSAEGFATTVAFANTRLHPGTSIRDRTVTGINALFLPFHVQVTDNTGQPRWLGIMALAGLDNLYGEHNPSGMVIADYGDDYRFPAEAVKPEPEPTPPPDSPPP
jgi:hypothetical protein